jgi:phage protein D
MPEVSVPVKSARPIILIDGQPADDLAAALNALRIEERSDGLAHCELAFGNWGLRDGVNNYTLFGRDRLEFGKRIEIKLGDQRVFSGRIMALEGRFPHGGIPELLIFAEDRLQDLRMKRRTRSFEQQSDADVARSVASDHGLQSSINFSGPTHAVLAQVNQSDLAFLRERARAAGAELWIEDDTLHLAPRPARAEGTTIALAYGGTLLGFDVRADLALQRSQLTVSGWNPRDKAAISESASASVLSSELNGGESGAALVQSALGARADTVAHLNPSDASEARALAESWLRQIGRRFVVGRGKASPDARIKPGAKLDLSGLGPLFNGKYTVTEVCHRFDLAEGARSEFTVERPAIGRP